MSANVTLSTRVLKILKTNKVKPSRFLRMLGTKKPASSVATRSGVSARTIQQYRQDAATNTTFDYGTPTSQA